MNVFINRQLIYNYPEQLFADKGIMAIEHADFDGIERLALVTGGEIVSTFGNPEKVKIGRCDLIEQVSIGDETLLKISGVPLGEACSVVLRGATEQIIGEAERSLHDALCVLTSTVKEPRTLYGGGCSELLMARRQELCPALLMLSDNCPPSLLRMVAMTLPSWSVSSRQSIFLVKAPWV